MSFYQQSIQKIHAQSRVLLQAALCAFFVLYASLSAADTRNIAVLDFKAQGIAETEARGYTDLLRSHLVRDGRLTVLDRGNMQRIMDEQSFQQSGCTDTACAVEIGQLLNMRYMVVGSLTKFGTSYVIVAEMIDVADGRIITSENITTTDMGELLSMTPDLVRKLANVALRDGSAADEAVTDDVASAPTAEEKRLAAEEARRKEEELKAAEEARLEKEAERKEKQRAARVRREARSRAIDAAWQKRRESSPLMFNAALETGNGTLLNLLAEWRLAGTRVGIGEIGFGASFAFDTGSHTLLDTDIDLLLLAPAGYAVWHIMPRPDNRFILDLRLRAGMYVLSSRLEEHGITEYLNQKSWFFFAPELVAGWGPVYLAASVPIAPGSGAAPIFQAGAGIRFWQ